MKKVAIVFIVLVWFAPLFGLISVGVLANPALLSAASLCSTPTLTVTGTILDTLNATTTDGTPVTLDKVQLAHAATIITVGAKTSGVGRNGILIALMAALTESRLRMLANTSAYPPSASYPNDGDGSDHDSLGLFQMRPRAGWGTVAQLMDPDYQAAAFYGGSTGPNHRSPQGLLDVPDWQSMPLGEAAQTVEVSAFPNRYAAYEPVAEAIVAALTGNSSMHSEPQSVSGGSDCTVSVNARQLAETLMGAYRTVTFTGSQPEVISKEIAPIAHGMNIPVCGVDTRILQVLVLTLKHFGSVGISDLGRPCVGSTLDCPYSAHCTVPTRAVDFTSIGGQRLNGSNSADIRLLRFLNHILPTGSNAGQSECRTSASTPIILTHIAQFADPCDHQHIDIRAIGNDPLIP